MGSDNPAPPADMHIPASARVQDLIPDAAAPRSLRFVPSQHYALRTSPTAALPTSVRTVRMEAQATTIKGTADAPVWSFGLGRDDLEVKLGKPAMAQAEAGLAAYYSRLFGQTETRAALRTMVQSHPQWVAVDTSSADTLQGLRIDAISLSSGERSDEDGDGSYESAQTLVTVTMTLPAMQLPAPSNPLPGCSRLLADTASMAQYAQQSDAMFVPPGAAQWKYQIGLTAHFYVADLALLHAGVIEPGKGYLTQAQAAMAADNLALFSQLIGNIQALDIPSSDLMVSFVPAPELANQTLGLISGLARSVNDADCLRDVDAWEATPSMLQAGLTPAQLQGLAPPTYMLQTYSPAMDAADGMVGEFGTTCLHDVSGKVLQVGDTLACATASGPIELEPLIGAAAGASQGFSVVTPYQRIALRAATGGQCGTSPQNLTQGLDHVRIGDFYWNCTNTKYAACTSKFGRGNRVCMSEWIIHNQVGDYWNIHWTQNAWKSTKQRIIKTSAYVIRAAMSYYVGGRSWVGPMLEMLTYAGDVIDKASSTKIAGYSVIGIKAVGGVVKEVVTNFKDVGEDVKNAGIMFAFDMAVDMFAQIVEVQVTGWQDYSHDSHCVCDFEFRDPNYCK
ncbi:MAG: hypothetical protein KKH74_09050 [Gammaproteobacteria bacterium]|nr:hypothetical protein [Gammaproteobacteria bacterium]MBU1731886.1 hypothetical protein [Gammaproteobacteria bacterium]MBU1891400.1 hypothetical protein [Gammaproteobacteria bacterium]